MIAAKEQELRWHLAAMVSRLPLDAKELQAAMSALKGYLEDGSSIVRTFALQGMTELAEAEPSLRSGIVAILRAAAREGTPAMKARSRRLLLRLEAI